MLKIFHFLLAQFPHSNHTYSWDTKSKLREKIPFLLLISSRLHRWKGIRHFSIVRPASSPTPSQKFPKKYLYFYYFIRAYWIFIFLESLILHSQTPSTTIFIKNRVKIRFIANLVFQSIIKLVGTLLDMAGG